MATYVLVHGAWGGAHGFRKVRPLLRAEGHEVFTPSLTGIGERSHLTGPYVTLSTHIQDVVNVLRYEDLRDVVLLGFSYGGMVVTGAVPRIGDRVKHVVYLDAFVPGDGDSLATLTGRFGPDNDELGAEWLVPPIEREYDSPEAAAWATARRAPQPVGTFTEPVRLPKTLEDQPFSLTYIRATADPAGEGFEAPAQRARTSPAWQYHEIATNHLIPENRPEELSRILLELAS